MGVRFKKRVKIAKGIYINIGKNGVSSISGGVKGVTVSSSGHATLSLPGTGLSYREKIGVGSGYQSSASDYDEDSSQVRINPNTQYIDFLTPEDMAESITEQGFSFRVTPYKSSGIRKAAYFLLVVASAVIFHEITGKNGLLAAIPAAGVLALYHSVVVKRKHEKETISRASREYSTFYNGTLTEINESIEKYGDLETTAKIYFNHLWVGETKSQLLDSFGRPDKINEEVKKDSVTHEYFYNPIGSRSFELRVTLDNGVVSGWKNNG